MEDEHDWRRYLIPESDDRFDYWVIPENTILYKGVDVAFPDGQLPAPISFYGSLDVASTYAFNGTKRTGESGKVITVRTTVPIKILDITSHTLTGLFQMRGANRDQLHNAFGTPEHLRRKSLYGFDEPLAEHICSLGFSGFGYNQITAFHPEILLCSNDELVRNDLDYRLVGQEPRCLFGLSSKGIEKVVPTNMYSAQSVPTVQRQIDRPNDRYIPELRQNARALCAGPLAEYQNKVNQMMTAIQRRDYPAVNRLLHQGIQTTEITDAAIRTQDPELIRLFLEAGMSVKLIDVEYQLTPDVIRLALDYGADPEVYAKLITKYPSIIPDLVRAGINGNSLFGALGFNMNFDLFKAILDAGVNPNLAFTEVYGMTDRHIHELFRHGANDLSAFPKNLNNIGFASITAPVLARILILYPDRISQRDLLAIKTMIDRQTGQVRSILERANLYNLVNSLIK